MVRKQSQNQNQQKISIWLIKRKLQILLIELFIKQQMKEIFDHAWKSIVRPVKFTHRISALCPQYQNINGRTLQRIDLSFKNKRGNLLSAVIFKQADQKPQHVILYLHGNGGSKLQSLGFVPILCQNKVALISFDFVGCGNSEEGFLTYGLNQSKDAEEVIYQANKIFSIERIIVWGRSMGAVTSILFCERNKHMIDALILDCPFQKLSNVVKRVIATQTSLPNQITKILLYFLSKEIGNKVGFQIFEIDYLQNYQKYCKNVPTLFFYSQKDKLVPKEEVLKFYEVCRSEKDFVQILEEHEEERCIDVLETGIRWIKTLRKKKAAKLKLCYTSLEIQTNQYRVKSTRFCCN